MEPSKCNHCHSRDIKFMQQLTFEYWFCNSCKKEVTDDGNAYYEYSDLYGVDLSEDEEDSNQLNAQVNLPVGNTVPSSKVSSLAELERFCQSFKGFVNIEYRPQPNVGDKYAYVTYSLFPKDPHGFIHNIKSELERVLPTKHNSLSMTLVSSNFTVDVSGRYDIEFSFWVDSLFSKPQGNSNTLPLTITTQADINNFLINFVTPVEFISSHIGTINNNTNNGFEVEGAYKIVGNDPDLFMERFELELKSRLPVNLSLSPIGYLKKDVQAGLLWRIDLNFKITP